MWCEDKYVSTLVSIPAFPIGEEDEEKTPGSVADLGQQVGVTHYDVTLEGLQLALIDRHNFPDGSSGKKPSYWACYKFHM